MCTQKPPKQNAVGVIYACHSSA